MLVGPREKIVMAIMAHGLSTLHQPPFWPGCETQKYCQSLLESTGRGVGKTSRAQWTKEGVQCESGPLPSTELFTGCLDKMVYAPDPEKDLLSVSLDTEESNPRLPYCLV